MAVIFDVEHDEMTRRFPLVRRQVGQVLECVQGLAVFADEDAQVLAMQVKQDFIGLDHLFDDDVDAHVLEDFLEEGFGLSRCFFCREGFFSSFGRFRYSQYRIFLRKAFCFYADSRFGSFRSRRFFGFFQLAFHSRDDGYAFFFGDTYLSRLAAEAEKAAFRFFQDFDVDFIFHSAETYQAGTDGIFNRFSCSFDGTHASDRAPFFLRWVMRYCCAHWNTLETTQ